MKFLYARFKGYIGFYNGLGLQELEIDFSSSSHRVVVITGINGCGKSTLLNHLNVMPDNSTDFVPDMTAEKELVIMDQGTQYRILIKSPVSKSGRGKTVAFVSKNGEELNPNGNISSYKDIIFSEFEMDANYMSLSKLSSSDTGLAGKPPSERKKFMSTIVDSLEVYNNIYKTMNRKSLIFKSHINTLHTKIQNIGDEGMLRSNISGMIRKINLLRTEEDQIKDAISKAEAKLEMMGVDGSETKAYEDACLSLEESEKKANELYTNFQRNAAKLRLGTDLDLVAKMLVEKHDLLENQEKELQQYSVELTGLRARLNDIENDRMSLIIRKEKLSEGFDKELEDKIHHIESRIENFNSLMESCYLKSDLDIIGLRRFIDFMNEIIHCIDVFMDCKSCGEIRRIIDFEEKRKYLSEKRIRLDSLSKEIEIRRKEMETLEEAEKRLENRPSKCKIDTCPFIKDAYSVQTKYINRSFVSMQTEIAKDEDEVKHLIHEIETLSRLEVEYDVLKEIERRIEQNKDILYICNLGISFYTYWKDTVYNSGTMNFNQYRDLQIFEELINAYKVYESDRMCKVQLESEYKIQKSNMESIQEIDLRLESIASEIQQKCGKIESLDKLVNDLVKLSSETKRIFEQLQMIFSSGTEYQKAVEEANEWKEKVDQIRRQSSESLEIARRIHDYRDQLNKVHQELSVIEPQMISLQGKLDMLAEYKKEYQTYSEKYNMIDMIKRYTSPSKGGIQSLFIQMYMSKTLDLCNQILSMIFGGEYRLLDFVIDANEFRIPFIGSGLAVDDISSGSTSQICIIGMIINLVLLHQGSTKFNITRLDEIDSGLDTRNKTDFVNVLYRVIEILKIEQLFIISHSSEMEMSNVDIIRLRTHDDYETFNGNVIYDYNRIVKTSE